MVEGLFRRGPTLSHPDLVQGRLGFGLQTFGQFVEHVDRLVHPATLLAQVGALNKAGAAALTLIEEVDELAPDILYAAYDASEWAANSQSLELIRRLNRAARKAFTTLQGELKVGAVGDAIFNKPCDLSGEVLKFEARLIRRALAQANGSVTRAARLLGMTYQGLAYVIGNRHKDLLTERSPVRRRSRRVQPETTK